MRRTHNTGRRQLRRLLQQLLNVEDARAAGVQVWLDDGP
jgi:hypothetical protein